MKKGYILIDELNIVRCISSEEGNLHDDKLHLEKYFVAIQGRVGDEYDPGTGTWTPMPENYPPVPKSEMIEGKIRAEMRKQAIDRLVAAGEIPEGTE